MKFMKVEFQADSFVWPKRCSSCGKNAEHTYELDKEHRRTITGPPLRTVQIWTSRLFIPVCRECLKLYKMQKSFELFWVLSFLIPGSLWLFLNILADDYIAGIIGMVPGSDSYFWLTTLLCAILIVVSVVILINRSLTNALKDGALAIEIEYEDYTPVDHGEDIHILFFEIYTDKASKYVEDLISLNKGSIVELEESV